MLKKPFLICLFFLMPLVTFAAGNKYGVFVGVGKYPREEDVLESSFNDATVMCKAFSADCGNTNVILLRDQSATRHNILKSVLDLQKKADKEDLFVFYYSGHGTLFPDKFSEELDEKIGIRASVKQDKLQISNTGEKFDAALIPFDSIQNTDNKNWRNLILDDELYRLFAEFTKKGVRVVFISDSCYSGGQAKGGLELSRKKQNKLGKAKFLDWKDAIGIKNENELKSGSLIQNTFKPDPSLVNMYIMIASSQENELSFSENPETGKEMSLFTYYFMDVFNKYKKAGKPFTFETIKNVVSQKVAEYTENNGASQNPKIDISFYNKSLSIPIF